MSTPLRSPTTSTLKVSPASLAKLTLLASALVARYVITPALAAPFYSDPQSSSSQFDYSISAHGKKKPEDEVPRTPLKLVLDILSIAGLVILGGIFAGLTLGLMGLDMVNLQVLSTSGTEDEQKHAKKVLKLLEKGRHWVLVVLLLGNVIGANIFVPVCYLPSLLTPFLLTLPSQ
jgi:metal transporter CNNM